MIPEIEFKEKARTFKVPISTIERDYAQSWLLVYIPEMAFKGGTGIRKAYIDNYRFSDDLDFTLLQTRKIDNIKDDTQNALDKVRNKIGINFLEEIKFEEVENGYALTVYFRILRTAGDPLKIKLDITKKDNETIIRPLIKKNIYHPYSDDLQKQILVYSLEEIFAEKTRALFERTRPRDLYDVWYLSRNTKFDSALFKTKCKFKNIVPDVENIINRKIQFINAWENSLKHQLKELPQANETFESVIKFLRNKI